MIFKTFLLSTVPLLIVATGQMPSLDDLQDLIARSKTSQICSARRDAALSSAFAALSEAQHCQSRSLPPREYSRLLPICRTRAETAAALSRCLRRTAPSPNSPSCIPAKHSLETAQHACRRLGLDAPNASLPPRCPLLAPLRKRLRAARALECPLPPPRSIADLQVLLAKEAERVRKRLGVPLPPYEYFSVEPADGVANAVVVLLTGIGGFASELVPLADAGVASGLFPRTRFVIPQAPVARVDFFNRTTASWFNVFGNTRDEPQAETEIVAAAAGVKAILEVQEKVFGVGGKRVVLVGVSQGGGLALTVYLRYVVGGVAVLSGYVPLDYTYPEALEPGSQEAPALMRHGGEDVVVPTESARASRDLLRSLGRNVVYEEVEGVGHELTRTLPTFLFRNSGFVRSILT